MAGTVLVNVTPNPYSEIALEAWRQGHFLNFNGPAAPDGDVVAISRVALPGQSPPAGADRLFRESLGRFRGRNSYHSLKDRLS